MELEINKTGNGYSVVISRGDISGESYQLNNTDEVLGRAVSLILDFFRAYQPAGKPTVETV